VRKELGWEPQVGFDELIQMMVEADLKLVQSTAGATVNAGA
jgi:GDP-D-mannose dehydratase